jgi:lipid A oxidase
MTASTTTARIWAGKSNRPRAVRAFLSLSHIDPYANALAAALLAAIGLSGLDLAAPDLNAMAQASTEKRNPAVENTAAATPDMLIAPRRETVVGAYGGAPYTYPSDVTITKPGSHDFTATDVEWAGKPFHNPVYYGVRVQRWVGAGTTGAMLDFTHSKTISKPEQDVKFSGTLDGKPITPEAKIKDVFKRLEASHGHNMLTLNGLLRLPSLTSRLSPYVGLGAGISLPHSEVQLNGDAARTYEYQNAGAVTQALIGIEFRLPRSSYFLEYKFSLAPYTMPLTYQDGTFLFGDLWRQFSRWLKGEQPPGGYLNTRLTSHQVIGGIAVRVPSP